MSEEDAPAARALLADPRLLSVLAITAVAITGNQAAPVALPGIGDSLSVSDADLGLVMTAFFLPAAAMLLVVGSLADTYGRRRVVVPSMLVFGVAGAGIFFVDSFAALLALRVLQGAAFPALTPLSTALVGDLYDGAAGTTAQGLRASANGLASIVGPAAAGALAAIAWQYPFLLAALMFPAAALVYRYLPETAAGDRSGPADGFATYFQGIVDQFRDANLQLMAAGATAIYAVKFAIVTFLPLFAVRVLGASTVIAGLLLSVRGVVRIVVSPLSGALVARRSRKGVLVGTMLLVAGSTALMPLLPALPGLEAAAYGQVLALAALMGAYSAGEALFNPVLNDTVVDIAADERRGGIVNGISVFKDAASAVSPAVFGVVLAAAGFRVLFVAAAAIPVVYAGLLLVTFDAERLPTAAATE